MRRGHHDDVGDAAGDAGNPEACSSTNPSTSDTSKTRTDKGAKSHQRGDQLLSFSLNVPPSRAFRLRALVSIDLPHGKSVMPFAKVD